MAGSYNAYGGNNNPLDSYGSSVQNRGIYDRLLKRLSNYGMNYNDMVIKNQMGVGMNEDPYSLKGNSMYDFFSSRAVASVLTRKSIPYLDKAYPDKRRILREYSIKDEIRDFITTVADEMIVYNDDSDFCQPINLSNEYPDEVHDKYQEVFKRIYNKFGFSDSITAWNICRDFLIDGYYAAEIIYDDKRKEIIGFNRLRPETLVPSYEPSIGYLWVQYPEDPQLRRVFMDSQIIYISYSTQDDYSETSYVEGLIRPYNQLKILQQTKIMFNIVNATVYQKFTIPIGEMSRQQAEEQVGQLIHDYSEEVEWDDSMGTVSINGSKHLNYQKQIWFPSGPSGTPEMTLESPQGHNLNDDNMLDWFFKALKRASKIPMSRFDADGEGGLVIETRDINRDEIKFNNFIRRLRETIKDIIVKPMRLQMQIAFPEYLDDDAFVKNIDISFYSNQLFEEMIKINNLERRTQAITTLQGLKLGERDYFHIEYLMAEVFRLSEEDRTENEKYWILDAQNNGGAAVSTEAGDDFGGEGESDIGGGSDVFDSGGSDDFDSGGSDDVVSDTEDTSTEFDF